MSVDNQKCSEGHRQLWLGDHWEPCRACSRNNPSTLNLARARQILASPHLPWTTEIKQALAQAYIDHTQAIDLLNATLDRLEREVAEAHTMLRDVEVELSEARADLRHLCGVKS